MGADRPRRLSTLGACLAAMLAVTLGLPASSISARHHAKKPHRCTLETRWVSDSSGTQFGDTKDFSVKFKLVGTPPPESSPGAVAKVEVVVHNPRIIMCSATISGWEAIPGGPTRLTKPFHLSIGAHGGLSSPAILPAYFYAPEAQAYARLK